jgi:hypothetical protein
VLLFQVRSIPSCFSLLIKTLQKSLETSTSRSEELHQQVLLESKFLSRSTTRVAKTNAASTSQQGNNSNQRKRKVDKATMRCFNCKKEGHLVSDCLDPRCYTCAIQFAALADRKEHEKVVHKRQKKKKRDNDTIAVNLATTMETCGDCEMTKMHDYQM